MPPSARMCFRNSALCEVVMAAFSLGVLVFASLLSMIVGCHRQTLAMRMLGLRLEQEVSRLVAVMNVRGNRVKDVR